MKRPMHVGAVTSCGIVDQFATLQLSNNVFAFIETISAFDDVSESINTLSLKSKS